MKKNLNHLSELQLAEFRIFKEFVDVCKRHNLKYYLAGGSLLGAYRHKGFIPWDDDMDVSMPREDYERFKKIAEKELPGEMYLSTFDSPGHIWLVPRIIDKNTKFFLNNASEQKEIGAWLDILIIDGMPNNFIWRKLFSALYLFGRMLYQFSNFSTSVNIQKKRPAWQMGLIKFAKYSHIEKILSPVKMGHFYDWICKMNALEKCNDWAQFSGVLGLGLGEITPKEWYGDGTLLAFEDMTVNGMAEMDKYLTFKYGDYMTPPPLNERNHHNVTRAD